MASVGVVASGRPTCYPTCMDKTSVYLSSVERERLAHLARMEDVSQAEVIRRAIRSYAPAAGDRAFKLARSYVGPGGSVSESSEEELLDGFGQ